MPLAFLAAASPVPLLVCVAFLSGVGLALGNSVWESTVQRHVPAESLSRVASYDWFGSLAFFPLGLAIWGPLAGEIGVTTALWLAFGLFAAAVATLLALPDTRRLRSPERR
jgi:MFS family permease